MERTQKLPLDPHCNRKKNYWTSIWMSKGTQWSANMSAPGCSNFSLCGRLELSARAIKFSFGAVVFCVIWKPCVCCLVAIQKIRVTVLLPACSVYQYSAGPASCAIISADMITIRRNVTSLPARRIHWVTRSLKVSREPAPAKFASSPLARYFRSLSITPTGDHQSFLWLCLRSSN